MLCICLDRWREGRGATWPIRACYRWRAGMCAELARRTFPTAMVLLNAIKGSARGRSVAGPRNLRSS